MVGSTLSAIRRIPNGYIYPDIGDLSIGIDDAVGTISAGFTFAVDSLSGFRRLDNMPTWTN